MSAITLIYTSRRSEVWRWYWRLWRKKLWMYHAYFVVCILVMAGSFDGHWPPHSYKSISYGLVVVAAVIAFFILYPQLMFKSGQRTLTVSEGGIDTTVGGKWWGTVKWEKITAIQETPDVITIARKNGNAFLIPDRAFNSDKEKSEFLASVQAWRVHRA